MIELLNYNSSLRSTTALTQIRSCGTGETHATSAALYRFFVAVWVFVSSFDRIRHFTLLAADQPIFLALARFVAAFGEFFAQLVHLAVAIGACATVGALRHRSDTFLAVDALVAVAVDAAATAFFASYSAAACGLRIEGEICKVEAIIVIHIVHGDVVDTVLLGVHSCHCLHFIIVRIVSKGRSEIHRSSPTALRCGTR